MTKFSHVATRDGYGWEVDDIGPAPALGQVLEAFWDDTSGEFTFWSAPQQSLPFALVEHFAGGPRRREPLGCRVDLHAGASRWPTLSIQPSDT